MPGTILDVILICVVTVIAFALFASERLRVDLVALLALATVIGQCRTGF